MAYLNTYANLRAVCAAVPAGIVEERSAKAFAHQLPVVPKLLRAEPGTPAAALQQELQLPLPLEG